MQPEFRQLENKLRQQKTYLEEETAARYRRLYQNNATIKSGAIYGAGYMHELVLVAAALYPAEASLENAFTWASQPQGLLKRHAIREEHLRALLHCYFDVAQTLLKDEPTLLNAARQVEQKMADVLTRTAKGVAAAGA